MPLGTRPTTRCTRFPLPHGLAHVGGAAGFIDEDRFAGSSEGCLSFQAARVRPRLLDGVHGFLKLMPSAAKNRQTVP